MNELEYFGALFLFLPSHVLLSLCWRFATQHMIINHWYSDTLQEPQFTVFQMVLPLVFVVFTYFPRNGIFCQWVPELFYRDANKSLISIYILSFRFTDFFPPGVFVSRSDEVLYATDALHPEYFLYVPNSIQWIHSNNCRNNF